MSYVPGVLVVLRAARGGRLRGFGPPRWAPPPWLGEALLVGGGVALFLCYALFRLWG